MGQETWRVPRLATNIHTPGVVIQLGCLKSVLRVPCRVEAYREMGREYASIRNKREDGKK